MLATIQNLLMESALESTLADPAHLLVLQILLCTSSLENQQEA